MATTPVTFRLECKNTNFFPNTTIFLKNCVKKVGINLAYSVQSFIDKTNKMLDEFEKDDARWRALGKKLGLDF